jgi:hypothetical protein
MKTTYILSQEVNELGYKSSTVVVKKFNSDDFKTMFPYIKNIEDNKGSHLMIEGKKNMKKFIFNLQMNLSLEGLETQQCKLDDYGN